MCDVFDMWPAPLSLFSWPSAQIIDIRVKQLQELHPQNLYFDTSFFGFLCPSTERVRAYNQAAA